MEEIELPGHRFYKRIEEAYVPPLEYDDIVNTLKEKRIVFITGTQEYGKTFTAVRLMWEYYNYGYKPSWIKGGELPERIEVRKRLENIRAELKPKHIIYYEDPFGKIRYERRETLEREIGTILDSVRQVEDVYVIITSREEVFKEFEKDKLSAKELKDFERRLNIKRPSYDYENRKRILLNWAEESNCRWLKDEKLKGLVLEEMKDKSILPTPLSIRDFAVASFDIEKEDELKEKLREKSKETAKAFAEEIRNMTDDKILFLSFIFIIDEFEVEFVRRMYQELVKELNLKDAWEFDRVLEWFKDDKIDIEHGGFSKIEFIEFSHPSYAEALEYILIENGYLTRISKDIFSKVLLKLSKIEKNEYEYAGYFIREVARTVAWHFSGLPEDVRNQLLLELSEKKEAARGVALAIAGNFNKLPESVRYLLFKLSERNAGDVAWAIVRYFNELPEDVRNLLFKLSEKVGAVYDIAEAIIINFYKLPENVRNLLFKLSRKKIVVDVIARAVAENFKYLPEDVRNQLLLKLSKKDEAVKEVARVVAENFTDIPKDMRNQLLLELSKKDKAMKNIARAIAENFNELPEDVRNQLLLELSEREIAKLKSESMGSIVRFLIFQFPLRVDDTVAGYIARAIIENFNELPEDVRNQLFKLSEVSEYEVTRYLAELIAENFNKPPEDIARNLLFKLSKINEGGVAWAIAANFNNLPEDVRNLLFKLSGGRYYVWDIALAVKAYFDELPEDVRNQLLLKLSKKNEAAEYVTWTVIHNFDKLSKDVIENLLKIKRIQKALEKIISEWKKY
ncbi:MAG: hypothetical protein QMD80_07160 [archaeon]|nr:hypothetical protein [archaeon]